jgi:capsid assembly protease
MMEQVAEPREYSRIWRAVTETPWAVLPSTFETIQEVLNLHAAGFRFSADEIRERLEAARMGSPRQGAQRTKGVQVIPVYGTIAQRMGSLEEASGGTSAESLLSQVRAAMDDTDVSAIVLEWDSPGGAALGLTEAHADLRAMRGRKPLLSHVNHMAASAAYWLATATDAISVSPSGEVGSIGVFTAHRDLSGAYERAGVKTTLISAGKFKTEGNPYSPLSAEALAATQERVNEIYSLFVADVARGRGRNQAEVRDGFGEGRMVSAKRAVKLGMADQTETLNAAISRLLQGQPAKAARASVDLEDDEEETVQTVEPSASLPVDEYELRRRRARARGGLTAAAV